MNGKGSARRPGSIPESEWAKRWEETFRQNEVPASDIPPDEEPGAEP